MNLCQVTAGRRASIKTHSDTALSDPTASRSRRRFVRVYDKEGSRAPALGRLFCILDSAPQTPHQSQPRGPSRAIHKIGTYSAKGNVLPRANEVVRILSSECHNTGVQCPNRNGWIWNRLRSGRVDTESTQMSGGSNSGWFIRSMGQKRSKALPRFRILGITPLLGVIHASGQILEALSARGGHCAEKMNAAVLAFKNGLRHSLDQLCNSPAAMLRAQMTCFGWRRQTAVTKSNDDGAHFWMDTANNVRDAPPRKYDRLYRAGFADHGDVASANRLCISCPSSTFCISSNSPCDCSSRARELAVASVSC